jgi:hypothetical protein
MLYILGYAHIHGAAWSNFETLEEIYPGLQKTFLKLKQSLWDQLGERYQERSRMGKKVKNS